MRRFYAAILSAADQDERLGLVIKPKNADNLDRLGGTRSSLQELCDEGGCLILDSSVTSVEAALSSDLTAGIGLNSAVLEGVVAGVPGVHVDISDLRTFFPFCENGLGRFVFRTVDDFLEGLAERRIAPDSNALGNHGSWRMQLDPYLDGLGGQRIGTFVGWALDGLNDGASAHDALGAAASRYESGENSSTVHALR